MKFHEFIQSVSSTGVFSDVVLTVIVVAGLWLLRLMIIKAIKQSPTDEGKNYKWRRITSYSIGLIGLVFLIAIWFEGLKSMGTFLGLFAAGTAIALREPLADIAAWAYITIRKPFNIGDRIQLAEQKGDIIDIRIFKVVILEIGNWVQGDQSTGRIIHIPNHKVFGEPVANYTSNFDFIWNELAVQLTLESDWKKAKVHLQQIADNRLKDFTKHAEKQVKRANKSYFIHFEYLTPIIYTKVNEAGINLTIRYPCNPQKRRELEHAIWEDFLELVESSENIKLAPST